MVDIVNSLDSRQCLKHCYWNRAEVFEQGTSMVTASAGCHNSWANWILAQPCSQQAVSSTSFWKQEGKSGPQGQKEPDNVSTAKNKDVNAIQWREMPFWSLPKEEKKKLPTMCWLASAESECNFPCYFIISHFCAKSAINSSCLQSCLWLSEVL